jgi:hypothetical protein
MRGNTLDGPKDERTRFVAVLEVQPVNSPQMAVKMAIVTELKRAKAN